MHFPRALPSSTSSDLAAGPSGPATLDRHLLDYLAILIRRRWLALAALGAALALAGLHLYTSTPLYEATAQLLIEHENRDQFSLEQSVAADRETTDYYNTQYTILQSRSLAARTLQQMGMWKKPDELKNDVPQQGRLTRMFTWVSAKLKGLKGAQAKRDEPAESGVRASAPTSTGPEETPEQTGMIDSFLGRLKITPVKTSRLVNIQVQSTNPKFAADAANALSKAYIDQNLEARMASSQETSDWLTSQLSAQRDRVRASETVLQRYRENHDAVSLADRQSIVTQKLNDLNAMVTKAKGDRISRESNYKQAMLVQQQAAPLDTLPAILSNSYLQQLKTDLQALQSEYAQKSRELGDQNPVMLQLRQSIQAADARLKDELSKQVDAMRNDFEAAKTLEENLTEALETQKKEVTRLDRTGIDYSSLEREVSTNRQIFETLLARTREKGIAGELKASEIRVVDPAQVPLSPIWPNRNQTLMYALFFGSLAGIGLAFFFEYVDDRIKTPEEIKRYLGLPFLGLVPVVDDVAADPVEAATAAAQEDAPLPSERPETDAAGDPIADGPFLHKRDTVNYVFMEAMRSLRTNMIFAAETRAPSIVVTSTGPGEGKTAVASNLAISLAMTGRQVLLVDTDMRRPKVHSVFDLEKTPGLSDVLTGRAKLADSCHRTSVPNLSILPAGSRTDNPAELLSSPRFVQVLERLVEVSQWVIIDSPPVGAVTDSCIVANRASAVLFVVGADQTRRPAAMNALEQLEKANATFVGAVLNRVHVKRDPLYYSAYYRPAYEKYYSQTKPAASPESLDATDGRTEAAPTSHPL